MSWANKDQYDIKTSEFLRDWGSAGGSVPNTRRMSVGNSATTR